MRKSFVALLLLVGAAAALASTAFARSEELAGDDVQAKMMNAQMAREMRSAAVRTGVSGPGNTTYVGFRPGKVTATNYWGIGKGNFKLWSNTVADYGYWGWDNDPLHNNIAEVHGDSLFGWWPYRNLWTSTGGLTLPDDQRPWWGEDHGNNVNYVINASQKRTFGVVGVWHRDNGSTGGNGVTWAPLNGSTHSLWCGLRREGDLAFVDPITGNPFNARIAMHSGIGGGTTGGGTGTNQLFPGYMSQWDQMAYRDVNVASASSVTVRFRFRTNMSTAYGTATGTRSGWFDKDPLKPAVALDGNFISSSAAGLAAPIDSFMVYVGGPVGYATGSNFVASDGNTYTVFDAQRRWLSETIRLDAPYYEVFTTYGDNAEQTKIGLTAPVQASWGGKARIVFRCKTNRGFDDEGGSVAGAYTSGGAGAVVIDDVEVSYDGGTTYTTLGDFETAAQVNNSTAVDPLDAWKSTGKPMAVFDHVHSVDDLLYEDLCGPVGGPYRICNMVGNVISSGDHDRSEAAGGIFGTADQERNNGMISPTINLLNGGIGSPNEMDIDDAVADVSEDYYIQFDIYAGIFDFFNSGNAWRFGFQAWPGTQVNNVQTWADWRFPGFIIFNPDKQCFQDVEGAFANSLLRWKTSGAGAAVNGAVYPDSIRTYFGKIQQCFRFGITTGCSPTDGCYFDNVTFAFIDGEVPPVGIDIWMLFNDTFTVNGGTNRAQVLPGSVDFDTTAALVKIGLNVAQTTANTLRFNVPGDTATVNAEGADTQIDLVFRINPGPGNYVAVGNKSTSLRQVPTSTTAVNIASPASPANFWEQYLINNGAFGTVGGHPAAAVNGGKQWSNLVWNSARCDSSEVNLWVILLRGIGIPAPGAWSTMYHESDPKFTVLGIAKNRCFTKTATAGATAANITCNLIGNPTDGWQNLAGYVASEDGLPNGQTYEYTKILPDGQFTPGTHVQYFFRRQDNNLGGQCPTGCLAPDTTTVFPQLSEGSTDAHRWQQFSVLPDAWKYRGGLGQACMLYVDLNDRRGNERVWVSIADSTGATASTKWGAHNGWHAPGTGTAAVNATSSFVYNLNEQPGTTWDMFGTKASESLNSKSGSIGAWNSNHAASLVDFKWSYAGPSIGMLEAYYKILLILTGDLNSSIIGRFNDFGNNDVVMLQDFMNGGTSGSPRGVFAEGDGFVESAAASLQLGLMSNFFKVSLRDPSYLVLTGNPNDCIDIVTSAPISSTDIYGLRNSCLWTNDVLTAGAGGAKSSEYKPAGFGTPPIISGVTHAVSGSEFWISLVDGWDVENLRSRFCDGSQGRVFYYTKAFTGVFGAICAITGTGGGVLEVPNNNNGSIFVDFMNLRNNPLVAGMATVELGISKADRVEVKVFDVSGRLVRTLADRQFAPGKYTLTWDGVDNGGRQVARGVYFTQVKYVNSKFTDAKKLTVLK